MKIFLRLFIVALFSLTLSSCSDEQDFGQFDALNVIPTAEASLVYVEVPEEVINLGSGLNFYSQTFDFGAFEEEFFAENVLDGVITYEVENTTSKPLDITIDFLDQSGNVLDTENFMLSPAPTAILQREISYGTPTGRPISIITSTSAIRVTGINLGDNTSVSSLPDPTVFLRSSAKFRIRLK
ncbi:MAG: hypothetical protein ACR2MM_13565 [Flavobacteriaceae bacterium]